MISIPTTLFNLANRSLFFKIIPRYPSISLGHRVIGRAYAMIRSVPGVPPTIFAESGTTRIELVFDNRKVFHNLNGIHAIVYFPVVLQSLLHLTVVMIDRLDTRSEGADHETSVRNAAGVWQKFN